MRVIPQADGSLYIEEPEKTAGFDLGNRSLFIKTNGRGDLNQIFFAHGAHAGAWQLRLLTGNSQALTFQTARALGRRWQLQHRSPAAEVDCTVFLEEKTPVAYERIEVRAPQQSGLDMLVELSLDISAPPSPKGKFKHVVATFLPRLPAFSWYWGWGMGRWLQTPAPKQMLQTGPAALTASGPVAWELTASQPFSACRVTGKTAKLQFAIHLDAGASTCLDLALNEAGQLTGPSALERCAAARQSADEYAAWLTSHIQINDPLLKTLYAAGLNASVSMFKEFPGGFKGLVAGPDYAFPPRIYFRDSYWTAQALLGTAPELVRAHLLSLASGVHPGGQCPSGIFASHLLKEWHAPANCDADWLADHFDSPSFFILLLNDYLNATGDWKLLDEIPAEISAGLHWPQRSVGQRAHAAIDYLIRRDSDNDGLIEKPYAANDWADNIRRSTWVAYDQALYIAALRAYARLCSHIEAGGQAETYLQKSQAALAGMQRELWDEELGYFVNYRRPEFTEKNLSVDSLVAVYFHLLEEPQARRILLAAQKLLRAAYNTDQPWGDYGLLCAFPLYSNAADLFDKSASPYCYHNGADWPYWDGMFANLLLERRDPAGLEVLTRWWAYGLEQGWLTPVEYYSPAYPVGGMLQGWSSMPAATLLRQFTVVKELLNAKAAK